MGKRTVAGTRARAVIRRGRSKAKIELIQSNRGGKQPPGMLEGVALDGLNASRRGSPCQYPRPCVWQREKLLKALETALGHSVVPCRSPTDARVSDGE